MKRSGFSFQPWEEEREWTAEGLPVLRARVSLPRPEGDDWRRVRRFYALQSRAFLRYCKGELLPWAEAAARASLEAGTVPVCCTAELSFRVTWQTERLWSLYTQLRETASPGPASLTRWGDTWDLETAFPLPVSAFFPPRTRWKRQLLDAAEAEILRQEREGVSRFSPGWRRSLRRSFNPRNYYLTEAGRILFYPMYTLAPAAEGIPAFLLPWDGAPPQAPLR